MRRRMMVAVIAISLLVPVTVRADVTPEFVGDNQVVVSWPAFPGATSYTVSVDGSLEGSTGDTGYVVSGLDADTVYQIDVEAYAADASDLGCVGSVKVQTRGFGWALGSYAVYVLVGAVAGAVAGFLRLVMRG